MGVLCARCERRGVLCVGGERWGELCAGRTLFCTLALCVVLCQYSSKVSQCVTLVRGGGGDVSMQ